MSPQEYIENSKALLERIEEDMGDKRAKNVAVLVQAIGKEKLYLDYSFLVRYLPFSPDKAEKKRIELMPLAKLREKLLAVVE